MEISLGTSWIVATLLLGAGVVGSGGALASRAAAGEKPRAQRDLPARVAQRVRELQPTPEERRLDQIGWARDLRDAERLAREHGRPVFLFTHDGRINTGRC